MNECKDQTAVVIGKNLRRYREYRRMTQSAFAALLSVDVQYYSQVERGAKKFKLNKLIEICGILQITLNELYPLNYEESSELKESLAKELMQIVRESNCKQISLLIKFANEILPYTGQT